jgi:hypothetical protein
VTWAAPSLDELNFHPLMCKWREFCTFLPSDILLWSVYPWELLEFAKRSLTRRIMFICSDRTGPT